MKIFLTGTKGKMEKAIMSLIQSDDPDNQYTQVDNLNECDIMIDFSSPSHTLEMVKEAVQNQKPIVIGTTGHSIQEKQEITKATSTIPIVMDTNMSVGVCVLRHLLRNAATWLDEDFEVEVFEAHHKDKVDSPSGTALTLANEIALARNLPEISRENCQTRQAGLVGPRKKAEIGMQVLRGGSIVGEHTAYFCGPSERIELTHRAANREIFARGALKAASFLFKSFESNNNPPQLYDMSDVIGVTSPN